MLGKSISKNSLILGGFAVITAGVLALTFGATEERIRDEEKRAAQKALLEIVPASRHNNDMLADTWTIPEQQLAQLGLSEASKIHIAKNSGLPVAAIIPSVAPDGYSGAIKLIVGVNLDGSISGARVLVHKETPGLGDKVDLNKNNWILSFNNTSLSSPAIEQWKVKKDGGAFDQFTGATITPRAVVKRIKQTLEYFEANKAQILGLETEASSEPIDVTTNTN